MNYNVTIPPHHPHSMTQEVTCSPSRGKCIYTTVSKEFFPSHKMCFLPLKTQTPAWNGHRSVKGKNRYLICCPVNFFRAFEREMIVGDQWGDQLLNWINLTVGAEHFQVTKMKWKQAKSPMCDTLLLLRRFTSVMATCTWHNRNYQKKRQHYLKILIFLLSHCNTKIP